MEAVRLSTHEAAAWYAARPHPNVLAPLAHSDKKRYVGLREGDAIVAAATLQKRPLGFCQIGGIFVDPSRRMAGTGRALMAAVRGEARVWGCRRLVLGAYRRPPDVSGFYRAVGFRAWLPLVPGTKTPVVGSVARGLAWVLRVEAGPDAVRVMVAKA